MIDQRSLLIIALAVSTLGGGFYVLIYPWLSGEAKAEKRQAALFNKAPRKSSERVIDAANRRKQVADSLKELEDRNKKKTRTLETRITQAGLTLTKHNFLIASAISGAVTTLLLLALSGSPLIALAGVPIGGFGLPNFWLSHTTNRRLKKFSLEFPNAVDVIVRGVRSGLPLGDCLRVIASEAGEPVRSEFRQIVEAQSMGMSITEAVERMPDRVPTPEANFFAIVVTIQQKAGGNLGEALANLSRVLRERKKMRDKVKAMSSEAMASAGIIGSLPLVVGVLVYVTSPHYIELLWITDTGRVVLSICALVMGTGLFIMKKMIAFDI